MTNTPRTMLDQVGRNTTQHDQVGRNTTQHDDASWGEIAVYVAAGLFIVYGIPWIITWAVLL